MLLMKHIFRLVRFPNLCIAALTMVLMRYGIVQPIFTLYGIELELPLMYFIFLVIAVVFIAAAGYMINDYFDQKTDLINRPHEVVVGKYISASMVYKAYFILNVIALGLSLYVSLKIGVFTLFTIFPLTIGVLWFYSTTYKSQLLIGNFLVSFITAIVPLLVPLYEMPLIHTKYAEFPEAYHILIKIVFAWCGIYAVFAFFMTMVRELIKDAEDFDGDLSIGRNTLPIVFGLKATRVVISGMLVLIIVMVGFVFSRYLAINCSGTFDVITFLYLFLFIILPLIVTIILLWIANVKRNYAIAATIIKLVIVAGIMYSIIVRVLMSKCV
jgi:4-hydroxybenzoate polyprenyltransferase